VYPITNRSTTNSPSHSPSAAEQNAPQASDANSAPNQAEVDSFACNQARVSQILNTSGRASPGRGQQHSEGEPLATPPTRIRLSPTLSERERAAITAAEERLLEICRDKGIEIKETLIKTINTCSDNKKEQFINLICCYFENVDPFTIKNSTTLTAMIYSGDGNASTRARITRLLGVDGEDVARVARSPHLTSISSMCHARGFPDLGRLDALLALSGLQVNGQVDAVLLRSISSMCNGRGLPAADAVEELLSCQNLRCNGEVVAERLRCISSMTHSRGIPDKAAVDALLGIEELQINGQISTEVLGCISSICYSGGLPDNDNLQKVLQLANRYGGGPLPLMKHITKLYRGRGMPGAEEIERLLSQPGLNRDGQLDLWLLEEVSRMHRGKGFPPDRVIKSVCGPFVPDDREASTSTAAGALATPSISGRRSGLQDRSRTSQPQTTPLASSGQRFLRNRRRATLPAAATLAVPQPSARSQPTPQDFQPRFTSFWPESLGRSQLMSSVNEQPLSIPGDGHLTGLQPSTSNTGQGQTASGSAAGMLDMIMECIAEEESASAQRSEQFDLAMEFIAEEESASAQRSEQFDLAIEFINEQSESTATTSAQPSSSATGVDAYSDQS